MNKVIVFLSLSLVMVLFGCRQKYYNQWVMIESNNYYYDDIGNKVKNKEYTIDGNTYYFDKSGKMATGFQSVGEKKKYFDNNGKLQKGWQRISNNQYYFDKKDGEMKTGWFEENSNWYYFNDEGVLLKDAWVDGDYYVDNNGKMLVGGYHIVEGKNIWFESNGKADLNHKDLERREIQILERNAYGHYNKMNNYPVRLFIEYDKNETLQNLAGMLLEALSDRDYVEITKITLVGDLGVTKALKVGKVYDLKIYDESGKVYDKTTLGISTADGMRWAFIAEPFLLELTENRNLIIKFDESYDYVK